MSNKTFYITEFQSSDKIVKMTFYRENLLQSILSDICTFSFILISFGINQYFIHSRMVSFILLIIFIVFMYSKTITRRISIDEFKKIIDELTDE